MTTDLQKTQQAIETIRQIANDPDTRSDLRDSLLHILESADKDLLEVQFAKAKSAQAGS